MTGQGAGFRIREQAPFIAGAAELRGKTRRPRRLQVCAEARGERTEPKDEGAGGAGRGAGEDAGRAEESAQKGDGEGRRKKAPGRGGKQRNVSPAA